jgi:hypothetical protein
MLKNTLTPQTLLEMDVESRFGWAVGIRRNVPGVQNGRYNGN